MTMTAGQATLFDAPVGLSLSEYTRMLGGAIRREPALQNAWVSAEISDFRRSGGHCYMELVEKNGNMLVAKLRATIWQSKAIELLYKFQNATGSELRSGMKVLVRGSANHHELYGLSFNITDIDPAYTLGDIERLRREILQQLQREGVLQLNRSLPFPEVPQKIAVISSETAAGYGDFMDQLLKNSQGFCFYPKLYPAIMQGARTSESVRAALAAIEETIDFWDCVVIIRGGGATTDLHDFDDLELARAVATFPLPIIVGIGHERDRNVLDEIACVRTKTPTAVAEYLIECLSQAWNRARDCADTLKSYIDSRLRGEERMLSSLTAGLPALCSDLLSRHKLHLHACGTALNGTAAAMIATARQRLATHAAVLKTVAARAAQEGDQRLDRLKTDLRNASALALRLQTDKCRALSDMVNAYSTESVLRRGYTITRINGRCVPSSSQLTPGDTLETEFHDGKIASKIL